MLKWEAKRLKHVWSNTDQTIDTSRWASVVRMPASNLFDTRLSKRTKHRPFKHEIKRRVFSCLIECLMAFKFYPTWPKTIKQHQQRCPNGKIFGHQTMFDGVWSSNIFRLVRAYTVYENHTVWNKRKKIQHTSWYCFNYEDLTSRPIAYFVKTTDLDLVFSLCNKSW